MKWLPIETAPKDGTLILIKEEAGRVVVASWTSPDAYHYDWYVQITNSGQDGYPTTDVVSWCNLPEEDKEGSYIDILRNCDPYRSELDNEVDLPNICKILSKAHKEYMLLLAKYSSKLK